MQDNLPNPNIRPLIDFVIVKRDDVLEKTKGGIIIPDTAKEEKRPNKGTVILTGPGLKDENMLVSRGQRILYGTYAGTPIEVEGEDYILMKHTDIYAIIDEPTNS